jgi:spore coat protein CotH
MKVYTRFLLSLTFLSGSVSTTILAQDLYDPATISDITIDFYKANWDEILDAYMAMDSDERILADVTINGVVYDSVGVRYKGNSSYRSDRAKNPLNIKLNYLKKHDYQGYYTLKLSNGFIDPSFVREVLALEIARKYMPAARAGYANVTINGTFTGLYTNVQSINDHFTNEHYYSEDRPFFEGAGDGPSPDGCSNLIWGFLGTDSTQCYPYYYDSKSGDHYSYLINFLDIFNNSPEAMEEVYNVDRHLWAMAFDIALVNLDAPISTPHNFYLYQDVNGRFNYIKWDMNMCFGVFNLLEWTLLDDTQMQQLDPFTNNNPQSPILYKVWQNERWKKMYLAHMITLMEENIGNSWYLERAGELQQGIDAAIQNDPNKFFSYEQSIDNLNNRVRGSVGISQLMDARNTYLIGTPYFQLAQPLISEVTHDPQTIVPNSDVTILAQISNASYAYLGYRASTHREFEKIEMFDDGAHSDGTSGDGSWGVTLPLEGTSLEYYIYAENEEAGIFSPARAEYEFHTLTSYGDVVINEFMASNDLTASDEDGEFDDWIELYNNTESEISLQGYYLSDKPDEPGKWQFPDTTIKAGEYLMVWADKDTLQQGLHANFKLSASGEDLILSNQDGDLVDQVFFYLQTTDISTGRNPNGTGIFMAMESTFAAENNSIIAHVKNQILKPELQLYPNPANDMLTIEVGGEEVHLVSLFNIFGQLQRQWQMGGSETIDITSLRPGIYIISVDGMSASKFIKR